MPKGKRKGKSDRNKNEGSLQTSDEDSMNDNYSLISGYSENHSVEEGIEEVDEVTLQDAFEDKLTEALDGITQKSAQGRTRCFEAITKALIKKYITDFVYDRRLTITDGIERSLRKGRGVEQGAAAELAPLLCIQLGSGAACEEVTKSLKSILSITANDNSVPALARAKCCGSLGLLTYLAGGEMGDVLELMQQLQVIFAGSYLKGDGSIPNIAADVATLHAAALSSWTLLFTLMAPSDVYSMMGNNSLLPSLIQLSQLLDSPHLEVRLSAGEAFATVFELGRDFHDDFAEDFTPDLVEKLRQLATDSHKYRAKKDRKQQRATFRDILHYIENDELSELQIRFGKEVLVLDSWTRRKQYDALCHILGPGINMHLAENELLRDIFQLGSRILITDAPTVKQTKLERHLLNAAAFKARTISRNKNRDKRSDF